MISTKFVLSPLRIQRAMQTLAGLITVLLAICAYGADLALTNTRSDPHRRITVARTLPIAFEPNVGQIDRPFNFLAHQNGLAVGFGIRQVEFSLTSSNGKPGRLLLSFDMSSPLAAPAVEGLLSGHVNYLRGNIRSSWKRGLPTYERLRYHDLYPGVDLVFYGNGQQMEHDFIVSAGTNPRCISMSVDGARATKLSRAGELVFEYEDGGQIVFRKPIAFQQTQHGKREVAVAYRMVGERIGFAIGTYDRSLPLTIDPVLDYSTYLANDYAGSAAVAADSHGNTYVTGFIFDPAYPISAGAFQAKCSSCPNTPDIFVTKFMADGSGQVYSTFLGGSGYDQASKLVVDGNGNAIVVGWTSSQDFPQKNSINSTANGYAMQWGFITSLTADGSSLNYSSVLGQVATASGTARTSVTAVALDSGGNAYITGMTDAPLFPTTPGALNALTPAYPNSAIFVSKILVTGALGYSAIVGDASPTNGGAGPVGPAAIAVDANGSAYVYGKAGTKWPITTGAYQPTIGGTAPYAAPFVTKMAADGSSLIYSTFVGNGYSIGGIAVNSAGQAVLTGGGSDNSYPTTSDALFPAYPSSPVFGSTASWLTILNNAGTGLVYSSYLSSGDASSSSLALDNSGNVWVAGTTADPKFPLVHPVQGLPGAATANGGIKTGFVMEFAPAAKNILFSTYIGGPSQPASVIGIALDSAGKAHITGAAQPGLYTTPGAFQGTVTPPPPNVYPAWSFAAKMDAGVAAPSLCITYPDDTGIGFFETTVGTSSSHLLTLGNCGTQPLSVGTITANNSLFSIPTNQNQCSASIAPGGICTLTVQFTPTAATTTNATLQIATNASIPVSVLPLSGTGAVPAISVSAQGNFDPLLVGQTSAAHLVSVSNTGMSPLQINLAASSITGDFSYTTSAACNGNLYIGGASCIFSVVFSPTAAGVRSGTLTIVSNDPAKPSVTVNLSGTGYATYPVPSINQLDPPTFPTGPAAFTANIFGGTFFPTSVVKVNGQAQTTTYSSSSVLRATIDPALRNNLGELTVTVSNPAPGGGESAAVTATLYQPLSVNASFMVYVPAAKLLYAAVGSSASSNANTVVPIDPSTGTTHSPIAVGKDPRMLVASDDGKYLYVALQRDQTIQRIDLASSMVDRTFPFPPNQVESGTMSVSDMHVIPGTSDNLVVAVGGEIALYRDAGLVNAVPTAYPPLTVSSFAFTNNASAAYALPFTDVQNHYFNVFTFDNAGVHYTRVTGTNFGPYDQTGAQVVSDGTLLYTNAGQVWNPATASLSGTFSVATYNSTSYPNLFSLALDGANDRIYLIGNQNYGSSSSSSALTISAYDKTTLQNTGTLAFPQVQDPTPTNLVRWGGDGLAFVGWDQKNFSITDVYLVRSRLVFQSPQPVVSLSAPSLTFDKQDEGTSSQTQTITLMNAGTAALVISRVAATGPFSVVNNCGTTVAVGASCTVSVSFVPTSAGAAAGTLTITDNAVSSPQTVTLLGTGTSPSFVLSAAPGGSTTATVTSGQTATYNLSVAGTPGFSGQITLTCTGAPANAACSISPASLTLAKGASSNFTASVTTQTTTTASLSHVGSWTTTFGVLAIFALPLAMVNGKSKSRHVTLTAIVLIGLVTFTSTACGGGQNTNPPGSTTHSATTPPGTYSLTITASSGSVITSQPLTLKVQ